MKFREFTLNDYESVIDLWKLAGLKLSRSDTYEGLKVKLKRDPDLFFVMEEEKRIIGVVMGSFDGRRGWINHLAFHPEYQGKKLGQQIIDDYKGVLRKSVVKK